MDATPRISRRRLLLGFGGLVAATAATHTIVHRREDKPARFYAPIVIPTGMAPLPAQRLTKLHERYDGVAAASGVAAMRANILSDIRGFRGHDIWLETIAEWIDLVGWTEAADFNVDIAELAGELGRRNCASALVDRPTPLMTAASHGPRIRKLAQAETDPTTIDYWNQIRKRLGV